MSLRMQCNCITSEQLMFASLCDGTNSGLLFLLPLTCVLVFSSVCVRKFVKFPESGDYHSDDKAGLSQAQWRL